MPQNQNLHPADFKKIKDKGTNMVLIDVRDYEEFEQGALPGAICVPLHEFSKETLAFKGVDHTKYDEQIICYCLSGARSAMACQIANQIGFKNVKNIEGGIIGLRQ